ncbi:MAG: homoserine dehydrogenase [Phycisphaerales bacterium]
MPLEAPSHMPEPDRPPRRARPAPTADALPHEIVVLKFGSSILASEAKIADAVHEVYREVRNGRRVVVVCSAMGDTTDRLAQRAGEISDKPHPAAYAALLAVGESHSSAQVTLAIEAAGIPATLLDPAQIDLRTTGDPVNAEPESMAAGPVRHELNMGNVVVLPGFAGRDRRGFTTLLGRGGSDLTALFVAHSVGAARCRLVKDVDGWYDADPKQPGARKFSTLTYDDALASPAKVAQPKCVKYAADHGLILEIGALGSETPSVIGAEETRKVPQGGPRRPVRVALLGLGTVGGGVMRHMLAEPAMYDVRSILVRDPSKYADKLEHPEVLTTSIDDVFATDPELVIEVIGGTGLAGELINRALDAGCNVVTANKALMARDGVALRALASERGVMLLDSAAVGGGVPMLETVDRIARDHEIAAISGVLNGTTNFILGRMARGTTYAEALEEAQRLGYAEADPTADVAGFDAAQKLCLLCRLAFDPEMPESAVEVSGIESLADGAPALERGFARRLVARASRRDDGTIGARVALETVREGSDLARARDESAVLIVHLADGRRETVIGRGAGRWPTAESVFADVAQAARRIDARA